MQLSCCAAVLLLSQWKQVHAQMSKRRLTVSASESGILRYPHLLSEPGVQDWDLPTGVEIRNKEKELVEDQGREPGYQHQETPLHTVTMAIIT